jgi:hypothetical protein
MARWRTGLLLLLTACPIAADGRSDAEFLRDADQAWSQRAAGAREGRPQPGPVRDSIRGYEAVLAREPARLDARWKLLRSLHFAGEFLAQTEAEQRDWFERATAVSETGLDELAGAFGGERPDAWEPALLEQRIAASPLSRDDVARFYFWSAINWGAWSRTVGLLAAVREGVAERLHRYTRVAVRLEPGYDEGGPYRLLGRLHAVLPRIPFLSGWVDRDRALPLIEQALALAPENPGNRYLLAVSLLDLRPGRRDEALGLLREVAALTPRPDMRIEDLELRREARERLAREG